MDIQITRAEETPDGVFVVIYRDITMDDGTVLKDSWERMPKETLAIRAAEYDLEVDDPFALDLLLLERFQTPEVKDVLHPLFAAPTVAEALDVMRGRIEKARDEHGAPKRMPMRSLWHAADRDESTQGLTDTKALLLQHADQTIGWAVQTNRDYERERLRRQERAGAGLAQATKAAALNLLHTVALAENEAMAPGRPPA